MFRSHMQPIMTLSLQDQIIIVSARSWGGAAGRWRETKILLINLLGESGGRALAADLDEFFNIFKLSVDRPVFVGKQGCGRLWADEELFVRAARMCRDGQEERLFEILFAILPPNSTIAALEVMCRIARRLKLVTRKKGHGRPICRTAEIVELANWQRSSSVKPRGAAERVA